MKTQEINLEKTESRQSRNHVLAIYIAFVTMLTISYSIVTAIQTL